jgi:hypothetical protein
VHQASTCQGQKETKRQVIDDEPERAACSRFCAFLRGIRGQLRSGRGDYKKRTWNRVIRPKKFGHIPEICVIQAAKAPEACNFVAPVFHDYTILRSAGRVTGTRGGHRRSPAAGPRRLLDRPGNRLQSIPLGARWRNGERMNSGGMKEGDAITC